MNKVDLLDGLKDVTVTEKQEVMDSNLIYKQLGEIVSYSGNMSKREIVRRLKGLMNKIGYKNDGYTRSTK